MLCLVQDEESEASYQRWLRRAKGPTSTIPEEDEWATTAAKPSPTQPTRQDDGEDEWGFLREMADARKLRRPVPQPPKCVFLTEQQARCKGEFTKRRRELLEAKHIPAAYGATTDGPGQFKSHSAMAMIGAGDGAGLSPGAEGTGE